MDIGYQLKRIRTIREQTLAGVASAVDLTASSLSQIENGKIFPSILTLESILKYYRIPMSEFFRQLEHSDLVTVHKGEIETIRDPSGILISLLASKLENNALESYDIELQPESCITLKELPSHINGERFIIVRNGEIEVATSKRTILLKEGDSINFKSYMSGSISNKSSSPAKVFVNGTPPVM